MRFPIARALACTSLLAIFAQAALAGFIPENERSIPKQIFYVSPQGSDEADGSEQRPFRSLTRAQQAVRGANVGADVVVVMSSGVYRLSEPLHFLAADGGQAGTTVVWQAAPGAMPVIVGSVPVSGWRQHDAAREIYVADVPPGTDARQIWVNDRLVKPGEIELPRNKVRFTAEGVMIDDPQFDYLATLPAQERIEVHSTGWFTNRFSPVQGIRGRALLMQQPAWDNNTWGYDTLNAPVGEETSHLFLSNSLAFLTAPDQFYVDPSAGKLYYRAAPTVPMDQVKVELPRLQYLVAIGGTYDRPVRDLSFRGIRFSYTSWMGPSSNEGYADQQSGAFLAGRSPMRPKDAVASCRWGCREFETRRNDWSQMPAAVQVSAAERISFEQSVFAHLGQIALGIGNNHAAHARGVGLGTRLVEVKGCVFTDLAGGAILAGGISRDAHHPTDPRMANRNLVVTNNRISNVSQVFRDNSAILATYVDGAVILHNDISEAPYDAIDIGWGWGVNDVGGNPVYHLARRGYYEHPENLLYDTPTTHRRVMVAYNRIYRVKTLFHDGGAIYNLSASPDTLIAENHVFDIPDRIGLYLDEGSRYITIRNNVIEGAGVWLNLNAMDDAYPLRATTDNVAFSNWYTQGRVGGSWTSYYNNLMRDNKQVNPRRLPADARAVIQNAGIEKNATIATYSPGAGE